MNKPDYLDENIERLLEKTEPQMKLPKASRDEILSKLLAQSFAPDKGLLRRILIPRTLAKLATAAIILIAAGIFLRGFNGSTAWAAVLKAFNEVENVHIVRKEIMPDGTVQQDEFWLRRSDHLRTDWPSSTVIDNGKDRLTINKEKKTAQFSDSWLPYRPLGQYYIFGPTKFFRGGDRKGYEFTKLAEQSNEKTLVYALHYKSSTTEFELEGMAWVDAETMLPLKIQVALVSEPEKGDFKSRETVFDYEPIPDEVFAMAIPTGFTELTRKPSGILSGKVLDENGEPVAGAIVYCVDTTRSFLEPIRTDDSGDFSFTLPPIDVQPTWFPIFLRAYKQDCPDQVAWTIIRSSDIKTEPGGDIPGEIEHIKELNYHGQICFGGASGVIIKMEPAAKITGMIKNIDDKPISNAQVWIGCHPVDRFGNEGDHGMEIGSLGGSGKYGRMQTQTNEDGRYEFNNLPRFWDKTVFILSASAKGYVGSGKRFRTEGALIEKQVNLQLHRAGMIVGGKLIDNYGEPLVEREIYARVDGKTYRSCRTKTDKNGRFKLIGCPVTENLQIYAELSQNHTSPHNKEKYNNYVYHPDVIVTIDYHEGKTEYEVELVAERPEFVLNVEVRNTAGQLLKYFPVEIRADAAISTEWEIVKKFRRRTDKKGTCTFTEVPNVKGLRLVLWGDNSVLHEQLSDEVKQIVEEHKQKYFWSEVPVEVLQGQKEYNIQAVALTHKEYEQMKQPQN